MLSSIHQLSKRYGDKICFNKISFTIEDHDKIGLIGRNGCGKSTLLKIIAGLDQSDEGEIVRKKELRMRICLQDQMFDEDKSIHQIVLDSLVDSKNSYEASSICTRLGLHELSRKASNLSGGEKRRLALACALAEPCDLLILDEPTNHLDPLMILWLEKFLIRFKGAILMVTHDRYFLERVCTKMMELDQGELMMTQANYSAYLVMKEKLIAERQAQHQKRQNFLRKETEWIRAGVQARSTKSRARIERYEVLKAIAAPQVHSKIELNFDSARLGGKTIEARNLGYSISERELFSQFNYLVDKEDRLGIIGVNGCGKSTLMKILSGQIPPQIGTVDYGETVKIGTLPQETSIEDLSIRVIDYLKSDSIETKDEVLSASSMLERFLFPKNMHYLTLAHCSGGERRRLGLLKVLMEQPNILFLDEPTNDLDIDTLQVLEEFLDEFKGAVIVVSHDRYFLDKLCDHVLIFNGSQIIERLGSFSENLELLAVETEKKPKPVPVQLKNKPNGLSYMEKKELTELEKKLPELESRIQTLENQLNGISDFSELRVISDELDLVRNQLEEAELRWIILTEKAEES
ncbi:MAG: ABC-F family ATP-binding cassette domain-containing protein [Erysipelotrichaceae bacterium]|nr:ABC-F family ATP-binding cassette domain-containing protein [Erysipelotrichaceae bacterium]